MDGRQVWTPTFSRPKRPAGCGDMHQLIFKDNKV